MAQENLDSWIPYKIIEEGNFNSQLLLLDKRKCRVTQFRNNCENSATLCNNVVILIREILRCDLIDNLHFIRL